MCRPLNKSAQQVVRYYGTYCTIGGFAAVICGLAAIAVAVADVSRCAHVRYVYMHTTIALSFQEKRKCTADIACYGTYNRWHSSCRWWPRGCHRYLTLGR